MVTYFGESRQTKKFVIMRQRQMGLESESNQGIGPRKKNSGSVSASHYFPEKNIFGVTRKKGF